MINAVSGIEILETVWLTQKQMGELFEVKQATLSVSTVRMRITLS